MNSNLGFCGGTFTALNFQVNENMVQPIENISGLKNQLVKNGEQVIENKAQSNFTFNGFFIETTH